MNWLCSLNWHTSDIHFRELIRLRRSLFPNTLLLQPTQHKKWSFALRISSVNMTKVRVTFTEEILTGKLHFLCSDSYPQVKHLTSLVIRWNECLPDLQINLYKMNTQRPSGYILWFRINDADCDLQWRISKINCESAASSLITIFRTFSKVN